ncbi:MAG: hypothetical protein NC037_06610 [Bacteroides sp.]|nr:hypothetical protein [Bacillota bacterium]MCM1394374.1 hypothetical protein [[Eubacterium] siraeum]MCM1456176.1 hypothetical protein [Bacteroides sp.]
MENISAIRQMLMGKHGNIESVEHSQEHYEAFEKFMEKYQNFHENIPIIPS